MSFVEIIVGHQWQDDARYIDSLHPRRPAESTLDVLELRDIIDIVIDGTNLTASIPEEAIFGIVGNILSGLVELTAGRSPKTIVEFYHEPWELVMVPDGSSLLLSVYSIDRRRRVVARDLKIDARTFIDAACAAGEQMLTDLFCVCDHLSAEGRMREFSRSLTTLKRAARTPMAEPIKSGQAGRQRVGATSTAGGLTLEYSFDADDRGLRTYRGAHDFDLHALLTSGSLEAEFEGKRIVLCQSFPALAVASLLDRTRQLFNIRESQGGDAFVLDGELAHFPVTVTGEGNTWELRAQNLDDGSWHSLEVSPDNCLDVLVSVAELFVQDLVRSNSHLEINQRLIDLEEEVEKLRQWYRDLCGNNVYLDQPENYLRQLGHVEPQSVPTTKVPSFPWPFDVVHTLFPRRRWTLEQARIDFSSLQATSRGMIVACEQSIRNLVPATGEELWRHEFDKPLRHERSMAVTGPYVMVTEGTGSLQILAIDDGTSKARVDHEGFGPELAGAAYYGDSHFGVATSRNGHLLGFGKDGELRWSQSTGPASLRTVVFDGPLVCSQSTEGVITAFNPETGDTLWKIRPGGTPELGAMMHQGRLYTITQDSLHRGSTLYSLYPFTGRTVWQIRLPGSVCGEPSFVDRWMIIPLERRGQTMLVGIDLEAVDPRINWSLELSSAGVVSPTKLLVAEFEGTAHGVVRTDRAELSCFRIVDGALRWRTMPASDTLLLYGNLPLFRVGDALVNISNTVDLRDLDTGTLLHSFDAIDTPEWAVLAAPFCLLLGERAGRGGQVDRLTGFTVEHFLALVE